MIDQKRLPPELFKLDAKRIRCGGDSDFTADVVCVKINGTEDDMAAVGRQARHHPNMQRVIY